MSDPTNNLSAAILEIGKLFGPKTAEEALMSAKLRKEQQELQMQDNANRIYMDPEATDEMINGAVMMMTNNHGNTIRAHEAQNATQRYGYDQQRIASQYGSDRALEGDMHGNILQAQVDTNKQISDPSGFGGLPTSAVAAINPGLSAAELAAKKPVQLSSDQVLANMQANNPDLVLQALANDNVVSPVILPDGTQTLAKNSDIIANKTPLAPTGSTTTDRSVGKRFEVTSPDGTTEEKMLSYIDTPDGTRTYYEDGPNGGKVALPEGATIRPMADAEVGTASQRGEHLNKVYTTNQVATITNDLVNTYVSNPQMSVFGLPASVQGAVQDVKALGASAISEIDRNGLSAKTEIEKIIQDAYESGDPERIEAAREAKAIIDKNEKDTRTFFSKEGYDPVYIKMQVGLNRIAMLQSYLDSGGNVRALAELEMKRSELGAKGGWMLAPENVLSRLIATHQINSSLFPMAARAAKLNEQSPEWQEHTRLNEEIMRNAERSGLFGKEKTVDAGASTGQTLTGKASTGVTYEYGQ